ncbi:MAG TPA: hypothetical protein VK191_13155 [Symbiobacteriaceae bacterium]|nr:hypothetical protein [Symbiobacteriaceae bacterium]
MEYKKLKLEPAQRRPANLKTPRITVKGYIGEYNALGKLCLAEVCKAWGLPVNRPAALVLHTPEGTTEYQLCGVPVMTAGAGDVPVIVNEDASKIKVDLYTYMTSINLHLGRRTKWVIYLKVAPGVDGKLCLFLDTQTDLAEIRRKQSGAQDGPAKSGPAAHT